MSKEAFSTRDIGAATVSPLIAAQTCTLPCNVTALIFSESGKYFAAALGDGTIQRIAFEKQANVNALHPIELLYRHEGAVTHLASFGDDLVSAGQDGRVVRHANNNGDEPKILAEGSLGWINDLAIHRRACLIAATSGDKVIVVRTDGSHVTTLDGYPSTVSGLAFDKTAARLAASHYNGVSINSLENGFLDVALEWKGSHTGLSWSPDDRFIVSTTQERELHVWDLITMQDFRMGGYPRKIHQMDWLDGGEILACSGADVITAWSFAGGGPKNKPPLEIGYVFGGTVTAVAAHPTKRYVAGGFSTGGVMIGGVVKGEARVAKPASGSPVTALAWSPDGSTLIAANEAGEINSFTLDEAFDVT